MVNIASPLEMEEASCISKVNEVCTGTTLIKHCHCTTESTGKTPFEGPTDTTAGGEDAKEVKFLFEGSSQVVLCSNRLKEQTSHSGDSIADVEIV